MTDTTDTTLTLTLSATYTTEHSRARQVGVPQNFEFAARVESVEIAREIAAQFPKSCKVIGTTLSTCTYDENGRHIIKGHISSRGWLLSDDVNKGVNETGIRRYYAVLKAAAKLGIAVEYSANWSNSYASQAAFEAALATTRKES